MDEMFPVPYGVHGSMERETVRRWLSSASSTVLTAEMISALPMWRLYTRGHLGHYTDRSEKLPYSGNGGACRWLYRTASFIATAHNSCILQLP